MKIEQLRFRNLNSLAGEWVIDFTDRELSDEGIFLITGPTGAGKTTILDAITLALYGQTPRLSSISTGGNEIMSRQQVNCFSEVIFSAGGKRYRALWSQRRARGKADGRLQAPYREFEDMTGAPGKPIDKIREVSRAVLEAVGMDFDGFTRSVMLTQGQFARFLNAQPADRAHILEKITGTDFYSAISRRCLRMRGEAAKNQSSYTSGSPTPGCSAAGKRQRSKQSRRPSMLTARRIRKSSRPYGARVSGLSAWTAPYGSARRPKPGERLL